MTNASLHADVDAGPCPLSDDPAAWYGKSAARSKDWVLNLGSEEIFEIEEAVKGAIEQGVDLVHMTEADFPLPTLAKRLHSVKAEILHGRGFALLRGWDSESRSIMENAYAFRGVGAYLGEAVAQNAKGHVLGHVANLGLDYSDPNTRGYQTRDTLEFHTDGGDIVGLLCVRPAKLGGLSSICSSTTVWNELVRRHPTLAQVATQAFYFSRVGEIRRGQKRYFESPIFQPSKGRMVAVLINSFIRKAQSFEEVPRLTEAQEEALVTIQTLANDPDIRLDMDFQPGDMQFLCNHFIFHSRTAYEDRPEIDQRRHLLRLWLSSADGPPLPPNLTSDFQGATASNRPNGIHIEGVRLIAPLQPE